MELPFQAPSFGGWEVNESVIGLWVSLYGMIGDVAGGLPKLRIENRDKERRVEWRYVQSGSTSFGVAGRFLLALSTVHAYLLCTEHMPPRWKG